MSLQYHDMVDQIEPTVSIDEYAAKMGTDDEIVTVSFIVNSRMVGEDLVSWFEKGYDFVLDASVSDGELEPGKYVVFVEMDRRTKVPKRIMTMLEDLESLTDMSVAEWKVLIGEDTIEADEQAIKQRMILDPSSYREKKENEGELNEMRAVAGLNTKPIYDKKDSILKDFIAAAGL